MVTYAIRIPKWLDKIIISPVLLYRRIRHKYTFRRIPLTQNKFAIVDADVFYNLCGYKWYAAKSSQTYYAGRIDTSGSRRVHISMHRMIMFDLNPKSETLNPKQIQNSNNEISKETKLNMQCRMQNNQCRSNEADYGSRKTDLVVDHINGDGLDNRLANLRLATAAQNSINRRRKAGKTSKHKGVSFIKSKQRYVAEITAGGKRMSLGHYKSEEEAARAYDAAALKYHGEFAVLNFPRKVK